MLRGKMVFFTCSHCGSALKKNKVEKHYALECRKPKAMSCMDCLKDFRGEEYASHNKCVSEMQKYSGQPSDGQLQFGKGERKQMEWTETVRQIVDAKGSSLTPQERQLLENLKDFENIPRKKKKFENFLKNAMGRYIDPRTIERVWSLLEAHKSDSNNKSEPAAVKNTSSEGNVGGEAEGGEQAQPEPEAAELSPPKETKKLSKKEKKEKKKKQKYELEIESISKEKPDEDNTNLGEEDMEINEEDTHVEANCVKSKKNKKKKKEKVGEGPKVEENVETAIVNGTKGGEKKKRKRKHNDVADIECGDKKRVKGGGEEENNVNEEGGVKETDVNGVSSEEATKKGKFKWDKTIVSILKAVPENELSVKRIRKKVLSEYQEAVGQGRCQELSLEEALGTFERKLNKIPGVKVLKDKAKLVKSS